MFSCSRANYTWSDQNFCIMLVLKVALKRPVSVTLHLLFATLERNWSRNASRNWFWDRYCWRVGQLLANFFPALETVPEVFAKANSAHFPSGFKSGESVLHQWERFFVTSSRFFYFNRYGQRQSGGTLVLGTRGKFNQIIKLKIHAGRVKYNLFCVFLL